MDNRPADGLTEETDGLSEEFTPAEEVPSDVYWEETEQTKTDIKIYYVFPSGKLWRVKTVGGGAKAFIRKQEALRYAHVSANGHPYIVYVKNAGGTFSLALKKGIYTEAPEAAEEVIPEEAAIAADEPAEEIVVAEEQPEGQPVVLKTRKGQVYETRPYNPETDPLLEVVDLKKYFVTDKTLMGRPTQFLKAVDGVSFKIKKGRTLGIVGESGCGKTTMGRTIIRLYDITGGDVWFKGQKVSALSDSEFDKLRPNMQMIFQDPYASLSPRLTVGAIIGEAALHHKLCTKENYQEYVLEIMKMCGLQPHYFGRYPHEFSGGQRQRICIARALALKPDLVICDEPVSALDVSIQAQIINMLKDLQTELGLTYVFISHDLSVIKHISDDVGVMYLGSMVEYGSKERIFENTLHPYTKALFSAVPVPNPHVKMNRIILKGDIPSPVNPPKGCKFHTRCESCMEICSQVAPAYKEVEEGHFCACHLYNTEEENAAYAAKAMEGKKRAKAEKAQKDERNAQEA